MRTISQDFLDEIDSERTINARATVRQMLPIFVEKDIDTPDRTLCSSTVVAYDSSPYGTGILRIAVVGAIENRQIYYQYVSDIEGTWPSWVATGYYVDDYCRPGLYGGRLFYQDTSGDIYYRDFNGSTWSSATLVLAGEAGVSASLAPVASTIVVYMWLHDIPSNDPIIGHIKIIYTGGSPAPVTWEGYTYGLNHYLWHFDAVKIGQATYIYYPTHDGKITYQLKYENGWWGQPTQVLPLDIVDSYSQFQLGGATVINSQAVVTGILDRPFGPSMHIYTRGPEHYTAGREMYIGNKYTHTTISGAATFPGLGGQLHLIGTKLVYAALGVAYIADGTMIFGVDNSSLEASITSLARLEMGANTNAGWRLQVDMDDPSEDLLVAGNELDLEISYGSEWAKIGTFGIDGVIDSREPGSQEITLRARSVASRALAMWKPDANYDYWSQSTVATNPANLTQLIRTTGLWSGTSELRLDQLNTNGIMYSIARPSRGVIVRARFTRPTIACRYGFILNYYRETVNECAERLEIDPEEVNENQRGYSGIGVIWGTDVNSYSQGLGIYQITNGVWGLPSVTDSLTIPADTPHWIQVEFYEGQIRFLYRLDSSTDWSLEHTTQISAADPWNTVGRGRTALYVRNMTTYAISAAFGSDASVIPVSLNTGFTSFPATVVVDTEQITVSGKSSSITIIEDIIAAEGYTLWDKYNDQPAPHDNAYTGPWDGYEIYVEGTDSETNHDYYDDMALVVVDGPGMGTAFKITDYDYVAPDQWDPSQSYTLPDTWMDHVGDPTHGDWIASNMRRFFVAENPRGIIGPGSVLEVWSSLLVSARGEIPVAHPAGVCSIYSDLSVETDWYQSASAEIDWSLEEMITELTRKAGAEVNPSRELEDTLTLTHAGWALTTDYNTWKIQRDENFVVKFMITSGTEVGMVLYEDTLNWGNGKLVTLSDDYARLYHIDSGGNPVLEERVPLPFIVTDHWVRLSTNGRMISIWLADREIATFYGNYPAPLSYSWFVSNGSSVIDVVWPELDQRVDNFVFDIGKSGTSLLQRLIGEKLAFYRDDVDGKLQVFRNRTTIPGTYTLSTGGGTMDSLADTVTRLRVEGGDAYEAIDYTALAAYGNLFALANSTELTDYNTVRKEAMRQLEEAIKGINSTSATGAADPRIEPQDIYQVTLPDGTHDIIVDQVAFTMFIDDTTAIFDMQLEGRDD